MNEIEQVIHQLNRRILKDQLRSISILDTLRGLNLQIDQAVASLDDFQKSQTKNFEQIEKNLDGAKGKK